MNRSAIFLYFTIEPEGLGRRETGRKRAEPLVASWGEKMQLLACNEQRFDPSSGLSGQSS
jgi:hypothetical protein